MAVSHKLTCMKLSFPRLRPFRRSSVMHGDMVITFLGTSSGGGPTRPRNCSSLVCDLLNDGSLWMVDCAEGTTRQFLFQPYGRPIVRASKVTKLFITHMHADHVMGIITFLRSILHPPRVEQASLEDLPPSRTVEIYGPAGIRSFIRQNFRMTATHTADHYVVHELLNPKDRVTLCNDFSPSQTEHSKSSQYPGWGASVHDWDVRHPSEERGRDIYAGEDTFWRGITSGIGRHGDIIVDAGPICHREPCIGYVFRENSDPHRKIVILGDTSDPSTIVPLCTNPSPSLLIHEATDTHIPHHIDAKLGRRDAEEVLSKTVGRGHSSPAMAGTFANIIGTRRLVLNHIGARFPGPSEDTNHRNWLILSEIQNQASHAWGSGMQAEVAFDHMRVVIPSGQNQDIQPYHSAASYHCPHSQRRMQVAAQSSFQVATGVDGVDSASRAYHQWNLHKYPGTREDLNKSRKRRR